MLDGEPVSQMESSVAVNSRTSLRSKTYFTPDKVFGRKTTSTSVAKPKPSTSLHNY